MSNVSKITLPNGSDINIKDSTAVRGLSSGTNQNNLVKWGSDGYTVADAGVAIQSDTISTQDNTKVPTNKAVASFVNSSVATNTANFVGTYKSLAELQAVQNPTNNDYGFVSTVDSAILTTSQPADWTTNYTDYYTYSGGVYTPVTGSSAPTWQANTYYKADNLIFSRYKYVASSTTWSYEYELNNSSFTAAEWDTIQSGLSALDKAQIATNTAAISAIKAVPAVGSTDDGKVLTASYSGGTGSYSWQPANDSPSIGYTTCNDSSSTTAKTASITGFVLSVGATVSVNFANELDLTSSNTLNISGTGAKTIRYNANNSLNLAIASGSVVTFMYDGTYYRIISISAGEQSTSVSGFTLTDVTVNDKRSWNGKQDTALSNYSMDTQEDTIISGITLQASIEQLDYRTTYTKEIISQTYNSTDCNISLILRQDSTEDLYVHYDTEARKLYMPYKVIKNQYKYWKDGVAYYKYHVLTEGVIMTNNSAKCNMLTSDTPEVTNETYNRTWVPTDDDGSAVTTVFSLSKANSEIGDVWYNRSYIIYADLETGMRYKMYGPVYKITAGTPCTVECATLSCTQLTSMLGDINTVLEGVL